MTDLNQFRRALQAPDPDLRPLDLATIMTAGARVRRRRRLTVGAASGLAVLVLLVGGGQLARSLAPAPAPLAPGATALTPPSGAATPSGTAADPSGTAAPDPTSPAPSQSSSPPAAEALGDLVRTGVRVGRGEWVIYVVPVESAELPNTTIGVKAVLLLGNGKAQGAGYLANETTGSDRSPGFHAGSGPQNIDDTDQPAFGYYVGRPDRITGKVDGRTVTAHQAPWSEDRSVTIWWFDLADVPTDAELSSLAAYDGNGDRMPAGNSTVAVG